MRNLLCIAALLVSGSGALAQAPTPTPTPALATTKVQVTWSDTTTGATFNVWRWTAGQNGFLKINTVPTAVTVVPCAPVVTGQTCYSYIDTIPLGVLYAYKISAVNGTQESPQSVEADITVAAPVTVPATPANIKVTVVITN